MIQKQPSNGVPRKRCSENMLQIYRRTMPKWSFNKAAMQRYWNHTSALMFSCKIVAYFQINFYKEDVWETASDDSNTGCLLYYNYFKEYCKMIAIDLNTQQALDADPKPIQQINFTGYLHRDRNTTIFSLIEEGKETILNFSQGTVRVL